MLKTTIGTSLLAASLLVCGATAATAEAGPTLGPYGYGALKLGMTAKQAKATGMVFEYKYGHNFLCDPWGLKKFPNGPGLWISRRYGVRYIGAAKGVRTPEGIKIGSTLSQLKAAYPHIKKLDGDYEWDGHDDPYKIKVPANKKASYVFGVKNGKVIGYHIELNKNDC